jgi:hypothetical protein
MKAGDRIVCICDFDDTHTKGNLYLINEITKNKIFITTNKGDLDYYGFSGNEKYKNWEFFSDYFVSLKECRKQKLEKLYEKM